MKNKIEKWGFPLVLQERKIGFLFDSNRINNLKSEHSRKYYEDLHCRDGSAKFCLYDFESNKIVFTMDFHTSNKFSKEKFLKLNILYVNDPELTNNGIATYYLKKLRDYAEEKEISKIKIEVDTEDPLFENKENTLSKKDLIKFYKSIENDKLFVEIIE